MSFGQSLSPAWAPVKETLSSLSKLRRHGQLP